MRKTKYTSSAIRQSVRSYCERGLGRFYVLRRAAALAYRLGHRGTSVTPFPSEFKDAPERVVAALLRDGLYPAFNLSDGTLQKIRQFVENEKCSGGFGDPRLGEIEFLHSDFRKVEELHGVKLLIAHYKNPMARCEAIHRLAHDSSVHAIVRDYLRTSVPEPEAMLWWSFPREATDAERLASSQTIRYHYDEFGIWAVYFSFYLTDVDEASGAHRCILESHMRKSLAHKIGPASRTDAEILRVYGQGREVTLVGKAGFGFVEDAACFHKATAPREKARLFLQLRFGLAKEKKRP